MNTIGLIDAFRYSDAPISAYVGAGGKTSTIFCAARELIEKKKSSTVKNVVIVTTTTHLGTWQAGLADQSMQPRSSRDLQKGLKKIDQGILLVTGEERNKRLNSLNPDMLEILRNFAFDNNYPLLIEADGSANHSIKAPAEHEPVIPEFVQDVIVLAGLSAIGKPLNNEWVHRPEIFAQLADMDLDKTIDVDGYVRVLGHKNGGLKNILSSMRRVLFLNQADNPEFQSKGRLIAEKLIDQYQAIIIGSLNLPAILNHTKNEEQYEHCCNIFAVNERVAGVVLAAGGASRFGKPKQILPWNGQTLIRHVVETAINAGLSPVIVVLGASGDEIAAHINDLPIQMVNNLDWKAGLSTSIRCGVNFLPKNIGGALFLHADQPGISVPFIKQIVEAHQKTFQPITAPLIDGKRGNPVLFDANLFSELKSLDGDVGGKRLFSRYPIEWVPWHDPRASLDIDTQEDYERLLMGSTGDKKWR